MTESTVYTLFDSARTAERAGDVEQALSRYKEVIDRFPESHEAIAARNDLRKLGGTLDVTSGSAITSSAQPQKEEDISSTVHTPVITHILYFLAFLSLIGGLIAGLILWPKTDALSPVRGSFAPALTWIIAGIIEAALFAALGKGLHYLKGIYENTGKSQ